MANNIKSKLKAIRDRAHELFMKRGDAVDAIILGLLTGEHVCLVGKWGIAKTAIVHFITKHIEGINRYEIQMFPETPPQELFGPYDIKALDEGVIRRCVDGYLPSAHVAFIDEFFNASGTVLPGLNSILQERQYWTGDRMIDCPLICLIAATNTVPLEIELQPVWDRFLFRVHLTPLMESHHVRDIRALLRYNSDPEKVMLDRFTLEELYDVRNEIEKIEITKFLQVYIEKLLRCYFQSNPKIYLSDRRIVKLQRALRAFLWFNEHIDVMDISVLMSMLLWNQPSDLSILKDVVNTPEVYDDVAVSLQKMREMLENKGSQYIKRIFPVLSQLQVLQNSGNISLKFKQEVESLIEIVEGAGDF